MADTRTGPLRLPEGNSAVKDCEGVDTFDLDPNTLPPVTNAFRQSWTTHNPGTIGTPLGAVATTFWMRATRDAIYTLE
ncbi:hypothetical protein [Mycobacteroides salmoniphilum]|uniref:hypothetical protein n=1 Tax=Mycobacteroides salmoniphilum TaxID=404941 RepID=UPI0009920861|nr:hypothetical protein [Mycobacteroides salmoniphilum]